MMNERQRICISMLMTTGIAWRKAQLAGCEGENPFLLTEKKDPGVADLLPQRRRSRHRGANDLSCPHPIGFVLRSLNACILRLAGVRGCNAAISKCKVCFLSASLVSGVVDGVHDCVSTSWPTVGSAESIGTVAVTPTLNHDRSK
jgi:hypothetical protein